MTELRDLVRGLGVSDVRMEQGSLRCDVNTSLNRPGEEWGTRTETKNVNSLRSVERAVRSEMIRQANILESGGRIVQETRHFHEDTGDTTSGRSKEDGDRLPVLPRARPRAARARPGVGGGAAGGAARAAPRPPEAAAGVVGNRGQGDAGGGQCRCRGADRGHGRRRGHAEGARKWWMGELARTRQRARRRPRGGRCDAGAGRRAAGARGRGQAQRQARSYRPRGCCSRARAPRPRS